jgi:hypothetical protein
MHRQRGQAVLETVLFLPMFMFVLFGVIWAIQTAVQYERVESAVRYSGLVSQYTNPYLNYSLYALYNQLGSTSVPSISCGTILTTPLSYASPTYTSVGSHAFFSPTSGGPTTNCLAQKLVGSPTGTNFSQDVILSEVWPKVTSSVAVPTTLQSILGQTSLTPEADSPFLSTVGINTLLACYPTLSTQVQNSLVYTDDTSSSSNLPSQITILSPITPVANSNCTSP